MSVTICLARTGTRPTDLVKPDYAATVPYKIQVDPATPALLYIAPSVSHPPDWAPFFDGFFDPDQFGQNSSTGALLIVERRNRHFVLPFGRARFMLNEDHLENKFGLKVALNCIGEGKVRSIQKRSLDQILRLSQEQASRDATTAEFGFDIEQDLLDGVTGTPSEPKHFGARVSGAESLHLTVPSRLGGLPDLLDRVADKFTDTSYKANFSWIDHIAEVTNSRLENDLNEALVREVAAGHTAGIWMAAPYIVDWVRISRFRFISPGRMWSDPDIHLKRFLEGMGNTPLTAELLKKKKVIALDEQGDAVQEWSVYKCIYAELDHEQHSYVLSGAKWYQVDKTFVDEVTSAYKKIKDYEGRFPEYQHPTEGAYLTAVSQGDPTKYFLMDQKFLHYPSKMEFCDLYKSNKDICHIKKYGQAGALSHLLSQGLISAELFKMDARFRQEVNKKLQPPYRLPDHGPKPKDGEYRIVFGIISDRPGALKIPFFSRLNFKNAAKRLDAFGYRVAIAKIAVEEQFSKTRKEVKRKKKE